MISELPSRSVSWLMVGWLAGGSAGCLAGCLSIQFLRWLMGGRLIFKVALIVYLVAFGMVLWLVSFNWNIDFVWFGSTH